MKIIKAKDYEDMSRKAANIISAQVILKPDCVLGLATGSTPIGAYKQLAAWYEKGDVDFAEVSTYNLDEYRGLSHDDPQSYHYFMRENFFDHINIDLNNTHVPDGSNPDAAAACSEYDKIVADAGYPDLQLLGIGNNGHIGFNEPDDHFSKGYALRRPHREYHSGQQPPVRQHRRCSPSGLHHGYPDHHVCPHDPGRRQRRGQGSGRA